MTAMSRRLGSRAAASMTARPVARWALVLATLVGVVVMHHLAAESRGARNGGERPAPAGHGPHRPAAAAAVEAVGGHCPQATGDCPDDRHGHRGQVCRAVPPGGAGAAPPVLAVLPDGPPAASLAVSPRTGAPDAGDGSGCGPPSLTQLSISRT